MNAKVSYKRVDNRISVVHGKNELPLFDVVSELRVLGTKNTLTNGMHNYVYVSSEVYKTISTKKPHIFAGPTQMQPVFPIEDKELKDGEIKLCYHLIRDCGFGDTEDGTITLAVMDEIDIKKAHIQRIEGIREDKVLVSEKDYRSFINNPKYKHIYLFELTNTITGDTVVVKKSHIEIDEKLQEGDIRINRKQRIFLGLTMIPFISDVEWRYLTSHEFKDPKGNSHEDVIKEVYVGNDHTKSSSVDYNKSFEAEKALEKIYNCPLIITPVVESFHKKGFFNPLEKIANFYAGKSTIILQCKRPYDIDEGSDVVRMSKTNMSLLGISEMDQVIITYKNSKMRCRVLELKNDEQYRATNRPFPIDFVIGVPSPIRQRIGIVDINSAIKIDRDTKFILRKSINEQIVPTLITLVSALIITNFEKIWAAVVSIVAIPIVIWINLSKYRNARNKLHK